MYSQFREIRGGDYKIKFILKQQKDEHQKCTIRSR